jgi:twitching motility two-component system response regulator PilH
MRRIFGNARPGERRHRPRAGTPRGLQVLVVDDSATTRAVLRKMLLQNGHIVVDADGGEAGLELARQHVPDLIFLDVVMPGLNGFAVLRTLRHDARTRDIPVIMISGNPQAAEQFYVQRFGADDFMKKPFGRGDVFARIARLVTAGRLSVRRRMSGLAAAADRARAAEPPDRHG